MTFAGLRGCAQGELLDYRTSLNVIPDASSFVGYGAVVFRPA